MRLTTDLFAYAAERIPSWNTISISGYHIREAGSTAVQELAFTLANGIAYCAAAVEAGLSPDEFGTVTGRKRRCGWFDATLVRQTVRTSGIDGIALTKLDILDGFETIKMGVGYRLDGETIDYFPASQGAQARVEPIYEAMEGWSQSTAGARSWADLPAQAIKYVRRVEELIGCPVAVLSTSPERDDTILMKNPFEG